MRRLVFKKSLLSVKALFAGALTMIVVDQLSRLLGRPWMAARMESIHDELQTVSTNTITVADYLQSQMWPVVLLSLSISAGAYFAGGYVAGRVANRNHLLNAALAFVLVIGIRLLVSGNGFREDVGLFIALAAIGLLITLLGCFVGEKLTVGHD